MVLNCLCGCIVSLLGHIYLGVGLLGQMVTLCLVIWRTGRLFSKVTAPFYIATSSLWESLFLQLLETFVIICVSDYRHSGVCEVMSHCGLICISLMANDVNIFFFFFFAYWPFAYLLWINIYPHPLPILYLDYLSFLLLSCKCPLDILDTRSLLYRQFSESYSLDLTFSLWFILS